MVNRVLLAFTFFSILFLTSGILLLIYALTGKRWSDAEPTEDNVIQSILYRQCPLDGKHIPYPTQEAEQLAWKEFASGRKTRRGIIGGRVKIS